MSSTTRMAGLVLAALFLAQPTVQADDNAREKRDRRKYEELVRDWRKGTDERITVSRKALQEARENGGKADAATLAHLSNVLDREDRILGHIEEIALRNGWKMPEAHRAGGGSTGTGISGIVSRADGVVRAALAREARAIARALKLPSTPLDD